MRRSAWVLAFVGVGIYLGVQLMGITSVTHREDAAGLQSVVAVPFAFRHVSWEVFSVPEGGRDSVPGPEDFQVLVAQFDVGNLKKDQLTAVTSADFFYNSARPWLSTAARTLIQQTLDKGGVLSSHAKCYSVEVAIPGPELRREPALVCQLDGNVLMHVITERR